MPVLFKRHFRRHRRHLTALNFLLGGKTQKIETADLKFGHYITGAGFCIGFEG